MSKNNFFFIAKAILAGLVIAFIIQWFYLDEPCDNCVRIFQSNETSFSCTDIECPNSASYSHAVEIASPSVVNIFSTKKAARHSPSIFNDPFFRRYFGPQSMPEQLQKQYSLGSGVIVSPDGYIITNFHVIEDAVEIRVALSDGRQLLAKLIGSDPESDLAALKTDAPNLPAAIFADAENLAVGDVVLAIGNPFGVGQTVTQGIVSATGRSQLGISTFENFIQTDAAINPGNSGGALINARGELIGINTAIVSRSGGSQGIGFAIPAGNAQKILADLIEFGRPIRGFLGIQGRSITQQMAQSLDLPVQQGILITGIMRTSPAAKAGILPGDIVVAINQQAITIPKQTQEIIANFRPGDNITISTYRGKQQMEIKAQVGERPTLSTN